MATIKIGGEGLEAARQPDQVDGPRLRFGLTRPSVMAHALCHREGLKRLGEPGAHHSPVPDPEVHAAVRREHPPRKGSIGWLDSYWALIIPQLPGSFRIFLCRQYFLSVPRGLYEAAKIDGCGPFKIFLHIYLPLAKPVLASLAILKSVAVWTDFFYPLIMTTSDSMRTVQLGLQAYRSYALFRWDLMMAACILVYLPLVLAFFAFQNTSCRRPSPRG